MKIKILILILAVFIITSCSIENPQNSEGVTTAFIAIHMEPGQNARSTDYQELHWPDLVSLVEKADEYNIKLTLLFNPQWATYILQDQEKLELLRSWEANGHEIGAHHHGPSYGNGWDGYTNQEQFKSSADYIGDMDDYITLLNQLPASGQILTGGIATDEDKPYDWPEGVIYNVDGFNYEDLTSTPTKIEYNGIESTYLTHATYYATKFDVSLKQIAETAKNSNEIMGIVFHEKNYPEHSTEIEKLFQFFQENNIQVIAVKDILSNY